MTAPAAAWHCYQLATGAWRLQHLPSASVVFVSKGATEAAVLRRRAEIEALITRLATRRPPQ